MADYKVSMRYAASLIDLADEKNMMDIISADMELITAAMEKSPALKKALENPVIRPELKTTILEEIFGNKINQETLHFVRFLVKKGRENLLYEISRKFLELRDEKSGIVNIEVRSAFELTDRQRDELKERLEKMLNKKARIRIEIEPGIVGGFIAKVNDTVYDASVKHQLEILKQQLLKGSKAALN
ncbi:MAG TPA: ATP synthase F1 subunit delta [Ignavibacteriaceae bacterium]